MTVLDQTITDKYAIYCGDCIEVMSHFPDASMHMSIYSPPFAGLYIYSSDERDMSNSRNYEEFMTHYDYVVKGLTRITMPGRISAVHCMDIPKSNSGRGDALLDFPGDIIRLYESNGWSYGARYHVWKEPLGVRNRTLIKGLTHSTVVEDASRCSVASADYLLIFRRDGENPVPVVHPNGFTEYAGSRQIPASLLRYRGWTGNQIENKYSQWIWRQYASAFWDDIRIENVLPFKKSREEDDEKHVHPLQLDVIERAILLWSNIGERIFTPFMGVGSEVYGAVKNGRLGIGAELKPSYYNQAVKNVEIAAADKPEELPLFNFISEENDNEPDSQDAKSVERDVTEKPDGLPLFNVGTKADWVARGFDEEE